MIRSILTVLLTTSVMVCPTTSRAQASEEKAVAGKDIEHKKPGTQTAIPGWARSARWYHIVVPRFDNAEPKNDPEHTLPWNSDWPVGDVTQEQAIRLDARSYGGDLQGVTRRLNYLKSLGVNTLLLSGVFRSTFKEELRATNHHHISNAVGTSEVVATPELRTFSNTVSSSSPPGDYGIYTWPLNGSDRLFMDLVRRAHAMGFRVVLATDLSDTSDPDRRGPAGDANQRLIVLRNWLDPDRDGDLSDGIDGYVLRDPGKLSHAFWKRLRTELKKVNADVFLVADVDGDPTPWLRGGEFDVAVDYGASRAIRRWFVPGRKGYTLTQFAADLTKLTTSRSAGVLASSPIALSAHRLGRLLSAIEGDGSSQASKDKTTPTSANDTSDAKWQLAVILQRFVGAPMTYYGDEFGARGVAWAASRGPMPWPAKQGTRDGRRGFFAPLIQWLGLRSDTDKALSMGEFRVVAVDPDKNTLIVARTMVDSEVIAVFNFSEKKRNVRVPIGAAGRMVALINPVLSPPARAIPRPAPAIKSDPSIAPLLMGVSSKYADSDGNVAAWVGSMGVRIILHEDGPAPQAPSFRPATRHNQDRNDAKIPKP